jgi:hypothetical protein
MGNAVFGAGAGAAAKTAFQAISNTPDGKLEESPTLRAAIEGLGSDVNFVFVSEPVAIAALISLKPNNPASAPVVLAGGRTLPSAEHPGSLWLRLDMANAAVQEFGHFADGF